ncbi:hypothetical protein TWF718_009116 [Orbilia javanica]|uniref:Uncharacterized protein n=1 Tax=Orbilia javanica TaxID=47235 RepID=A0AAN8MVC7_9PEZI
MLTAILLAALTFTCVHARDPIQNIVSNLNSGVGNNNAPNIAPPPGFSETLSIYGEPEPKRASPKTPATYFSIFLQLSSTNEWDVFNVSTTDYTTCHTLNPAVRPKRSRFRAAISSKGSRDAQPGVQNMMFSFPDNTVPPDISIKIFRNAPSVPKGGRVAAGSENPYGSCYEVAGSRESRVVNIKEWADMSKDDRLKWLKPRRWPWVQSYYRLRETDTFLVLPPPAQGRASLGTQVAPQTGRLTGFQAQRQGERSRLREKSYEAARELGIDFA